MRFVRIAPVSLAMAVAALPQTAKVAHAQDKKANILIGDFLATFREFQPSQTVGGFSLDQVLETLQAEPKGGN